MSGKLVTLINDADLTLAEASVLRVIADFSDDYGEGCWAGYVRLCRNGKLKRHVAIDTVKRLERKGIISVVGKHPLYGTNRWKDSRRPDSHAPTLGYLEGCIHPGPQRRGGQRWRGRIGCSRGCARCTSY